MMGVLPCLLPLYEQSLIAPRVVGEFLSELHAAWKYFELSGIPLRF